MAICGSHPPQTDVDKTVEKMSHSVCLAHGSGITYRKAAQKPGVVCGAEHHSLWLVAGELFCPRTLGTNSVVVLTRGTMPNHSKVQIVPQE